MRWENKTPQCTVNKTKAPSRKIFREINLQSIVLFQKIVISRNFCTMKTKKTKNSFLLAKIP